MLSSEPSGNFPQLVAAELIYARAAHEHHPTLEHSLAVLRRELDELAAEVHNRHRCDSRILAELVQVATVAQRMAEDNGLVVAALSRQEGQ